MNIFKKMGYNSKAKEIAVRREMQELYDLDFEDLCKEVGKYESDFPLFADLTLFAFYRFPCAYTACNVIELYVDAYNGRDLGDAELPNYEFFLSVGAFLEKGSVIEDVFDSKEYYLALAHYYILKDEQEMKKAFDVLVTIHPSFMDSSTQYLAGMVYYMLGMTDVAQKVLETSIDDMIASEKASASLILAKILSKTEDVCELLENAIKSTNPAIVTESANLLNERGKSDVVVKSVNDEDFVMNPELFYPLAQAYKTVGDSKKLDEYKERYSDDELYTAILERVEKGERVDVSAVNREINEQRMTEIVESELYEYADDVTKRMLNRQILETAGKETDYEERDYIELTPAYLK